MNIINDKFFLKRDLFSKGKRNLLKSIVSRRRRREVDLGVDLYMVVDASGLPIDLSHGRQMAQLTCASPRLMKGIPGWRLLTGGSKSRPSH